MARSPERRRPPMADKNILPDTETLERMGRIVRRTEVETAYKAYGMVGDLPPEDLIRELTGEGIPEHLKLAYANMQAYRDAETALRVA